MDRSLPVPQCAFESSEEILWIERFLEGLVRSLNLIGV